MDIRWIIGRTGDGPPIAERISDQTIRIARERWVHDCLELHPPTERIIYRAQGDHDDDDPDEWKAVSYELRKAGLEWQIHVPESEWQRWVSEAEQGIPAAEMLAKKDSVFAWVERDARERARRLRSVGFGWVSLAADVSQLLDALFGVDTDAST